MQQNFLSLPMSQKEEKSITSATEKKFFITLIGEPNSFLLFCFIHHILCSAPGCQAWRRKHTRVASYTSLVHVASTAADQVLVDVLADSPQKLCTPQILACTSLLPLLGMLWLRAGIPAEPHLLHINTSKRVKFQVGGLMAAPGGTSHPPH